MTGQGRLQSIPDPHPAPPQAPLPRSCLRRHRRGRRPRSLSNCPNMALACGAHARRSGAGRGDWGRCGAASFAMGLGESAGQGLRPLRGSATPSRASSARLRRGQARLPEAGRGAEGGTRRGRRLGAAGLPSCCCEPALRLQSPGSSTIPRRGVVSARSSPPTTSCLPVPPSQPLVRQADAGLQEEVWPGLRFNSLETLISRGEGQ